MKFIRAEQVDDASTVNAVVIPDNATNGDVIKALFPKAITSVDPFTDQLTSFDYETESQFFHTDWWNAPYEKGGE